MPPLQRLSFLGCAKGQARGLSSSSWSWPQGHLSKQVLHWSSPCPAGTGQGALSSHGAMRAIPPSCAPLMQCARAGLRCSTWFWGCLMPVPERGKTLCSAGGEDGPVQDAGRHALLCRSTEQTGALQAWGGGGCRGEPVIGKPLLCAALLRGWVCLEGMSGVSAPSQSPAGL